MAKCCDARPELGMGIGMDWGSSKKDLLESWYIYDMISKAAQLKCRMIHAIQIIDQCMCTSVYIYTSIEI